MTGAAGEGGVTVVVVPGAEPALVSHPSGLVPVGEMMTYCASRLAAAVVLPKWAAALTASTPSWCPVAEPGDAALSSTQTPASAPPVG